MPTQMLTHKKEQASETIAPEAVATNTGELRAAARRQGERVRRLKMNVAAWALGTIP